MGNGTFQAVKSVDPTRYIQIIPASRIQLKNNYLRAASIQPDTSPSGMHLFLDRIAPEWTEWLSYEKNIQIPYMVFIYVVTYNM